jgi:hypothetical protein
VATRAVAHEHEQRVRPLGPVLPPGAAARLLGTSTGAPAEDTPPWPQEADPVDLDVLRGGLDDLGDLDALPCGRIDGPLRLNQQLDSARTPATIHKSSQDRDRAQPVVTPPPRSRRHRGCARGLRGGIEQRNPAHPTRRGLPLLQGRRRC